MSLKELESQISTKKASPSEELTEETRKECLEALVSSIPKFSEEIQKIKEEEARKDAELLARQIAGVGVSNNTYRYKGETISINIIKNKEELLEWKNKMMLVNKKKVASKLGVEFDEEKNEISYRGESREYIESRGIIREWKNKINKTIKAEAKKIAIEKGIQEKKEEKQRIEKEAEEKLLQTIKNTGKALLIATLITVGGCEYHHNKKMEYYETNMNTISHLDKKNSKYLSQFKDTVNLAGITSLYRTDIDWLANFQAEEIDFKETEIEADDLNKLLKYQGKIICNKLMITDFEKTYIETLKKFLETHEIKELEIVGDAPLNSLTQSLLKSFNGEKLSIKGFKIDSKSLEIAKKANYSLNLGAIPNLSLEEYKQLVEEKNITFDKTTALKKIINSIKLTPDNIKLLDSLGIEIDLGTIENIDIKTFDLLQKTKHIKFNKDKAIFFIIHLNQNNPDIISQIDRLGYKASFSGFSGFNKEVYIALSNLKNISFDKKDTLEHLKIDLNISNIAWLNSLGINIDLKTISNIDLTVLKILLESKYIDFDRETTMKMIIKNMKITPKDIYKLNNLGIKINLGIFEGLSISNFELLQRNKNISFDTIATAQEITKELYRKNTVSFEEFKFIIKYKKRKKKTINGETISILEFNKFGLSSDYIEAIDQNNIKGLELGIDKISSEFAKSISKSNIQHLILNNITSLSDKEAKYISKFNLKSIELNGLTSLSSSSIDFLVKSNIESISIIGVKKLPKNSVKKLLSIKGMFKLNNGMRISINTNKYYNRYVAPENARIVFNLNDSKPYKMSKNEYPACIFDKDGLIEYTPCIKHEYINEYEVFNNVIYKRK